MVCLIGNERRINLDNDAYYLWVLPATVDMILTLDFQGDIVKITVSQESPQILL